MINFPSSGVLAAGTGLVTGAVGYYLHAEGMDRHRNPVAPFVLMGGVGYCISVLTGSRSPLIVAISLAITSLLTMVCMSALRSNRNKFLEMASITIPLATGVTFLVSNNYLDKACAIGFVVGAVLADLFLNNNNY